ncbi:MAG: hypothetical protein IJM39_08395 [Firmicutes bacterium]|nr:hypothetical protein [Bacillota bacterium]
MKTSKIIALIIAVCLTLSLAACTAPGNNSNNAAPSNNTTPANNTTPDNSGKELTPAEISEKAMENFVKKIEAGNYTTAVPEYMTICAVSPEQVHVDYPGDGIDGPVTHAYISLNGETFLAQFEDGKLEDIEYATTDNAIRTMGSALPNYWLEASGGNMYEFFYNDPEKPLEFTTNDETVKTTLCALGGYGSTIVGRMQEVRMALDAIDPASVRFTAEIPDEGRVVYEDLDLTLNFGTAESYPGIEEWLKAPVYPSERRDWDIYDEALLDGVFRRGYGRQSIPFPAVSSYAMQFDEDAYAKYTMARITDSHWTEKDVEDYKAVLKSKGFVEAEAEMPERGTVPVLRKLLREEYKAYSQLYITYDNGLLLDGIRYNEVPQYEGRPAISEVVEKRGFAELPETDVFGEWKASDYAMQRSEDWGYRFDYSFYLAFKLQYEDREAAKAYLSDYTDALIRKGFIEAHVSGEDNREARSANENVIFNYEFFPADSDNGEVTIWFKDQKCLTAEEANALIKEHGLPETDIHGDVNARDLSRYIYEDTGIKCLHLSVYQNYDSIKEADDYLNSYVARLIDQDYLPTDPQKFNSERTFLYLNEELRKYVGFSVSEGADGATVLYELVSFENDVEEPLMNQAMRR